MFANTPRDTLTPRAFPYGSQAECPDAVANKIPKEHGYGRTDLRKKVMHTRSGQQMHDYGIDEKSCPRQQSEFRRCGSMSPTAMEGEAIIEKIVDAGAEDKPYGRSRSRRHPEHVHEQNEQRVLDRGRNAAYDAEPQKSGEM